MQPKKSNAVTTETAPASTKPVLLEAIDLTLGTFEERTRLYRNLVVAVTLVTLASILTALLCWRGLPLAGLILVVPLIGGFLYLDRGRVSRWRTGILGMCRTRGLDLDLFRKTVSQLKHLPQGSVQSMLATLPAESPGEPLHEGPLFTGKNSHKSPDPDWKILVAPAALTLAIASAAMALYWRSLVPLFVTGGSAVVLAFSRRAKTP